MNHPKDISIKDFFYELPDDKIALYPPEERDSSKLLVSDRGVVSEDVYKNIARHIPANSLIIFNNTRVINARILFQKPTGGVIEIFCLEPYETISEYSTVMHKRESVRWKCMIGGAGKWKGGGLEKELAVGSRQLALKANLIEKLPDAYVVEFSWDPAGLSFAEVIELAGDVPLPPYLKRKTEKGDSERYQTIYAKDEGSVAAPTAGLHFTPEIFDRLEEKNIIPGFVTLHVGAGTFKPVKSPTMQGHEMHAEWIDVDIELIDRLMLNSDNNIIAVGTTSLRTLESLYWMGVKVLLQPSLQRVQLGQWEVYEEPLISTGISAEKALGGLSNWMKEKRMTRLFTQTQVLIAPGYPFKIVNALVTNFHQPHSTLLLLVAAAVGNDPAGFGWKNIYDHALQNGFRFLSYGDGCLLLFR